jgi:hypothetical protein
VVKGKYLERVDKAPKWYKKDQLQPIQLFLVRHVLEPDLLTQKYREQNPKRMPPLGASGNYHRRTAAQVLRRVPDRVHDRLLIDKGARRKMDMVEVEDDWEQWADAAEARAKERQEKASKRKEKKRAATLQGLTEEEE